MGKPRNAFEEAVRHVATLAGQHHVRSFCADLTAVTFCVYHTVDGRFHQRKRCPDSPIVGPAGEDACDRFVTVYYDEWRAVDAS